MIIAQKVAILIDGNNLQLSLNKLVRANKMVDFDKLVPDIVNERELARLIFFREGKSISKKLSDRLRRNYHGSVVPCNKSADIPLTVKAIQLAQKVDTIIILSGDADYIELVRHLKFEGVRVEIASFAKNTSKALVSEVDYFFQIDPSLYSYFHTRLVK